MLKNRHWNGTAEALEESTCRLLVEIIHETIEYWAKHGPRTDAGEVTFEGSQKLRGPDFQVAMEDFGEAGYTLGENLSVDELNEIEDVFISAVEDSVERAVLKTDHVIECLKSEDLDLNPETQWAELRKTPRDASIRNHIPWWEPVDTVLVLAGHPDGLLIMQGALRVLSHVPEFQEADGESASCMRRDIAARGAALEALSHVQMREQEMRQEEHWMWDDNEDGATRPSNCSEEAASSQSLYSHEEL